MLEEVEAGMEPDVSSAEIAGDARSILTRIAENRDQRDDTLTIDIPTWDGALKARYQVLEPKDIQKMVRRARARANGQATSSGVDADADFLSKACVEVIAYDSETDREVHVANGYTMDLAGMLDPKDDAGNPIKLGTTRELVAYLFKWNGIALATHAQTVGRWMSNPSTEISDPQ